MPTFKALLKFALAATAFAAGAQATGAPIQIAAFIHVNVVPMTQDQVLRDQTVLVEKGRIAFIGRGIAIPEGAEVIEGNGRFLLPGLADMHSHSDTREDLKVYLANGVTTILNMGGASAGFMDSIRPGANRGALPGPHVYAAFRVDGSPQYNNFFVTTPDEARAIVRIAKTNGYDFIKVYNDLSPECFEALIEEGKALHVPIVGHGVTAVGLRKQLDAGQVMVAHTEEFLYTVFYGPGDIPEAGAPDPSKIPGAINFVLRDKAFVTADLNTYATIARQWGKPAVAAAYLHSPDVRYLGPSDRILWAREDYKKRRGSLDARAAFLQRFIKAMSDAGVPLIAGTDAPSIPGLVAGFSLHDDLKALTEAGLTLYQALATATRTPGEFIRQSLGEQVPFGTVTVGARADLVLSQENPLANLATLRRPIGVMAAGRWYSAKELSGLLQSVATEYGRASSP
ncbi:amidohydrolase family protein [Sphingomonas agri]|uniref:amidohydrolase family protein n=1 Tax=Sphingomonas agri TaxID=1813878 RepID=UPI00311E36E0